MLHKIHFVSLTLSCALAAVTRKHQFLAKVTYFSARKYLPGQRSDDLVTGSGIDGAFEVIAYMIQLSASSVPFERTARARMLMCNHQAIYISMK